MNKKYLMNGLAALALIASVSSCVNDVELSQAELDAAAKENAELQLGITIPDGQTWDMSAQVSTDITINLGLDQSYTVGIYDVDPRFSKNSTFYALEKVNEGGVLNTSITLPNAMKTAYIAVYDSNLNLKTVKAASVANGAIVANVGGVAGNRAMRTVETWSETHTDGWESELSFSSEAEVIAAGAIDITKVKDNVDQYGNYNGKTGNVYYIPSTFNGYVDANWKVGIENGNSLYNFGKVDGINNLNFNGVVSIYNAGTWNWTIQSGQRHTIINTGNFTLANDANVGTFYNGGHLEITDTDISNDVSIYSKGDATINMPNGGDFKAACDIHGTLYAKNYLKIQNSKTQHVCGIVVEGQNGGDGTLDMTQGKLEASYVKADIIMFDGSSIWLLEEGHIIATKQIKMPNSASYIYGYEDSYGLIETKDFYLRNHNNFVDTFSDNIYFKITGTIDIQERVDVPNGNGGYQTNDEANQYTAAEYVISQNGSALKGRMNLDNVYGVSECGGNYGDIPEEVPGVKGNPIVYTYAFEDQYVAGDYDMNDVVLKVSHPYTIANSEYVYDTSKLDVKLVAAGATFNIKVKIGDTYLFSGKEIHEALGVNAGVMVNTGGTKTQNGVKPAVDQIAAPAGWDGDFNNLDVKIEVLSTNDVIEFVTETPKVAPYSVMIPTDWAWPTERTNVMDAYKGFKTWAEAETRTDAMNRWYETPVTGLIVTN